MDTTAEGRRFVDLRNCHAGAAIIVCGCGESLTRLTDPQGIVTIGVNDVGRWLTPDYLVVLNERRQFADDRYAYVEASRAGTLVTQLDPAGFAHPNVVQFRLGRRGGTVRSDDDTLAYSNNSPYVAIQLARHLGARRIGLVGVDFGDRHFFGQTGPHTLAAQLARIDAEYGALAAACLADGVELVNLSPISRLQSLPTADLSRWMSEAEEGARNSSDEDSSAAVRAGPGVMPISFMPLPVVPSAVARGVPRVFFVHYRFLSCGTVFDTGLRGAVDALGICGEHADWDAADLAARIAAFQPDLLFVVHGRRFVKRWGDRFAGIRSAVWLVDEPYEVDDTASWSGRFDVVFVNDPSTVSRHRNAYVLPMAYAPVLHHARLTADTSAHIPLHAQTQADANAAAHPTNRSRSVGFIGGGNPSRERLLGALSERGLLDYVVGGPWHDPRVAARCLSANVSPADAAALYRDTQIVINVFRDQHHFNRDAVPALAPNPRIFEALACGATVVSEPRPGLHALLPELPTFRTEAEAVDVVSLLLADDGARMRVQGACAARIQQARYADRLADALDIALGWPAAWARGDVQPDPAMPPSATRLPGQPQMTRSHSTQQQPTQPQPVRSPLTPSSAIPQQPTQGHLTQPNLVQLHLTSTPLTSFGTAAPRITDARLRSVLPFDADWDSIGPVVQATHDGVIVIDPGPQKGPALERGLVSRLRFDDVDIRFELRLTPGACLLAKVHQQHRIDQASNSYHLLLSDRRAYLARHDHVFRHIDPPGHDWAQMRLICADGVLTLVRDGRLLHRVRDAVLQDGFVFLGAQGGAVHLRSVQLRRSEPKDTPLARRDPLSHLPSHATWHQDPQQQPNPNPNQQPQPQPLSLYPATSSSAPRTAHPLRPVQTDRPRLSIITTVYDRVDCLRRCIASVQNLAFTNYEHLVVADHPPPDIVDAIHQIVDIVNDPRVGFYNLPDRHNDWGIAPAAAGLKLARGEYLAFLSDDNGYTPEHFEPLIRQLERDPSLGFVYCSCRYDGRLVLNHPVPRPGRIDLGQPLFRRELFEVHLGDDLPFDMMAWDWHLVDTLMRRGVRWKHIDRPTFLFRLAQYPELWAS